MPTFGCGSDLVVALSCFTFWWWLTQGRKNQVMIRKGIMAGIYRAVPGRGSRERWGKHGGASISELRSRKAWWEESRTQSKVRGAQGLQDRSRHDLLPWGPAHASGGGVWLLCPFLLPEPQLLFALGLLRPGVEALLCPHLWRRRPREAEAGASKASVGWASGCHKRRVRPAPCGWGGSLEKI